MLRFFIVVGDPSGDRYGALLMKSMKEQYPDCSFDGIGGSLMEEEGLKSIIPLETMSVVGFWEVLKRYSVLNDVLQRSKALLKTQQYDAFIPIDYPGFNLRLASFAKSIGTPVYYYIAPQLWAWGKNRAKKLANAVDELFVIFPFEVPFFQQFSINTTFVGHPLLDFPEYTSTNQLQRVKDIALFPGSRKQEIQRHLGLLVTTAKILKKQLPDYTFSFAQRPSLPLESFPEITQSKVPFQFKSSKELQTTSAAGLVKTGTTTLESFLLGLPFVMYYKTSTISYHISKRLITLPYIALPNIIANEPIIHERIQSEAVPVLMAIDILQILEIHNSEKYVIEQQRMKALLTSPKGAAKTVADLILSRLSKR